jgi:hypothetical protein
VFAARCSSYCSLLPVAAAQIREFQSSIAFRHSQRVLEEGYTVIPTGGYSTNGTTARQKTMVLKNPEKSRPDAVGDEGELTFEQLLQQTKEEELELRSA